MARIGLVTCVALSEPDPDREILAEALVRRGVEPSWVAWDDPGVPWSSFDLLALRSTWNYHLHREAFLAWAEVVSRSTRLVNPAAVAAWNSHKSYLLELERAGIPIVPTELLSKGARNGLGEVLARRGWRRAVVKPAVSGSSFGTWQVHASGAADGERALQEALALRDMMVQPYVESVHAYGERSIVWVDGEFTHAIRKAPRFAGEVEQVTEAPIEPDERALAGRILGTVAQPLVYARIDLARDERGVPMVMELELIEPSLFLLQCSAALERLAAALAARARE